MDPNAALAEIRELLAVDIEGDSWDEAALVLRERVESLDEWLSRGGFLPDEWGGYHIGDPDPTPDFSDPSCSSEHGRFFCTWQHGHTGKHVAGDGKHVVAVWGNEVPDAMGR